MRVTHADMPWAVAKLEPYSMISPERVVNAAPCGDGGLSSGEGIPTCRTSVPACRKVRSSTGCVDVGQDVTDGRTISARSKPRKPSSRFPVPLLRHGAWNSKAAAGDAVEVGSVIAVIRRRRRATRHGRGGRIAPEPAAGGTRASGLASQGGRARLSPLTGTTGRVRAMPSIRRIAKEHGIDLDHCRGHRAAADELRRKDILAILDAPSEPVPETTTA